MIIIFGKFLRTVYCSRAFNPHFYQSLSLAAEEIVNWELVVGWIQPAASRLETGDWSQNEGFLEEISFRISFSV